MLNSFFIFLLFLSAYSNIVLLMSKQYQPDHWMREERISKFLFQNSILQLKIHRVIFFSDYYGWKVLWRQQSCARKIHTELRRRRFVFLIIEQVLQGAIVSQWATCQWVFWDKWSLTMHFYSIKPWTGTVFVIVVFDILAAQPGGRGHL